jgi:hypothetical protein
VSQDRTIVMARYFAAANVLPGVHLSALVREEAAPRKKSAQPGRRRRTR